MKNPISTLVLLALLGANRLGAQEASVTFQPVFTPAAVPSDPKAPIPWDDWFARNSTVTDKGAYVHFFWNAVDVRGYFAGKAGKARLAQAAVQMVARLYPAGAKAGTVKVDIVFLQRDEYGMPVLSSLNKAAHFESTRANAVKWSKSPKPLSGADLGKAFDKFEFY